MIVSSHPGAVHVSEPRLVTEAEVVIFAAVTADWNPLHTDAIAADASTFGERIAHGLLSLSTGLESLTDLFGGGVRLTSLENVRFLKPVRYGDRLSMRSEVLERRNSGSELELYVRFGILNQVGETVISGRARIEVAAPAGDS